jgi:hypothetical protein
MNQQARNFANECVSHYAGYDKRNHAYKLNVYDLPEFIQNEFASVIMSDDNAWAAEATGPDNRHWESKMLPALTRYLRNSTDKDEAIEFNRIWRECVTDYLHNKMQELVNDSLPEIA